MPTLEFRPVDVREFHIGPFDLFPVGRLLLSYSSVSKTEKTEFGIKSAREILEEEGLIVLDAHRTDIDIVFTGAQLTQKLNLKRFVAPAARYLYDHPRYGPKLKQIEKTMHGVEFFPVVRGEERGSTDRELPSKVVDAKEAQRLNNEYFEKARGILSFPHQAVAIAPYGSRYTYKVKVRGGVRELLKEGYPAIVTLSQKQSRKLAGIIPRIPHHTLFVFPNVLRFSEDSSDEYISNVVNNVFQELEQMAKDGVSS
ncbi:MAG: hypothetical protein ABH812_01025 [bacterium]